jgi:hypothetical protein
MNNSNQQFHRSLGDLRENKKTKPNSPDLTGRIRLKLHTISWIIEQMEQSNTDEVTCCLAGWLNGEGDSKFITVELSPLYVKRAIGQTLLWRSGSVMETELEPHFSVSQRDKYSKE